MKRPPVNLVMFKPAGNTAPWVFDDSVEAVRYLLTLAGYQTHVSCNLIAPDALNILWGVGTHFAPPLEQIRAVAKPEFSLIFNMEQLDSGSALVTPEYLAFLAGYRVLDYNLRNIEILRRHVPAIRAAEFPLIPSPVLAGDFVRPADARRFAADLAFYGAQNPRRLQTLAAIAGRGLALKLVPGSFGPQLSAELMDARLVLNVHAYEASALFEVARCLRPLALDIPVVSERSILPASVDWSQSGIFFAEHADLAQTCGEILADPDRVQHALRRTRHFVHQPCWVELADAVMASLL